jgi:hypothetical protein
MLPPPKKQKRQGPKPVSDRGFLPGVGWAKAARTNPFAQWLKASRLQHQWLGKPVSQELMGQLMGWPARRIQKMEQGAQPPHIDWLLQLAEFFREDPDVVFLLSYNLPPDMQLFLTTTVEGERVVKNIRGIMNKVEQQGGAKRKRRVSPHISIDTLNKVDGPTGVFEFYEKLDHDNEMQRIISTADDPNSGQRQKRERH